MLTRILGINFKKIANKSTKFFRRCEQKGVAEEEGRSRSGLARGSPRWRFLKNVRTNIT
jgi:hypothetical protein